MDANMPTMNGYDAAARIREHCRSRNILQPMILIVTADQRISLNKIWSYEIDEYLLKPTNHEVIQDIV